MGPTFDRQSLKTLKASRRTAQPGEVNYALVDRYTFAHYAWGVLLGAGRVGPLGAFAFSVGWELAERPLKRLFGKYFPYSTQDTLPNAIGDAVGMLLGWGTWQVLELLSERRSQKVSSTQARVTPRAKKKLTP